MNAGNIFEAFFLAKEKIAKEPDIFSDPEYIATALYRWRSRVFPDNVLPAHRPDAVR